MKKGKGGKESLSPAWLRGTPPGFGGSEGPQSWQNSLILKSSSCHSHCSFLKPEMSVSTFCSLG